THDVWFENLTMRNADYGLVGHNSARLVLRRCHIYNVEFGLTCTNNDKDTVRNFFISDNVIEGPSTWPRTKGIEDARGIQVTGEGHVVCYNRIRGFADAIDTFPSQRCASIDFHNNDISEMTDDGIEMDYSERNTRCFLNRFTNVFQGVSVQPIYGGPVYIFRNALYNVALEPFKMHNSPSGALMLHNTVVKKGAPLVLWTSEKVRNCIYRNNLFIGTEAGYAYETTAPMENCDFDYDGFGGGPWEMFLKWNKGRYATLQEVKDKAPVYKHATLVEATAFASGIKQPDDEKKQFPATVDLRLKGGTAAIDAGEALPNFNNGFAGKAPDLGAYEYGSPLPHYGPRP
ncbi:MAG: right-handed parallel beta-helix repeat-containing protein, partial [Abitibacteriaceae bacterium]|nr:right-handed parallel beta-helix repeat-containing protein [Abditibacteriaceae bacterium]